MKKKDDDLLSAKAAIDRFTNAVSTHCVHYLLGRQLFAIYYCFRVQIHNVIQYFQTTKNSLSELEKRERRAMERKISEMEEELKVIWGFNFHCS